MNTININRKRHGRMQSLWLPGTILATMLAFTSCISDDTDFSDIIDATPDYALRDISFDESALTESETVPTDDNDYYENSTFSRTVYVTFADNTATVTTSAKGISTAIDGAHVTITTTKSGVNYVLSGSTTDGGFKVYSEKKFMLTLNGVSIANTTGAAINNQCGKRMYVHLAEGTTNSLTDGTTYDTPATEDEKGALFSEGQIIFSGSGTLNVTGCYKNGIASDDYIVVRPGGVVNVACSSRACLKANDGIFIRGGVLNLEATGDGGKALNSEADIEISGGRLTAIVSGGTLVSGTDTTGVAAIKCDSALLMRSGTVSLKCTGEGGKGINAKEAVTVEGGQLTIETFGSKSLASPKGIKTDGTLTFSGGSSYIYSANSSPVDAEGSLTVGETLTATYSTDGKLLLVE